MILVNVQINFITIDIRSTKVENSSWRSHRHDVCIEALEDVLTKVVDKRVLAFLIETPQRHKTNLELIEIFRKHTKPSRDS